MLAVSNLTVRIGDITILDDVSFDIRSNERLGLGGSSGSGKSMIAWSILGLAPQNAEVSGRVIFSTKRGQFDLLRRDESQGILGSEVAIIPQNPYTSLNPSITCGHQITLSDRARAISLLAELGLEEPDRIYDSYPHQLSGGQLQRVVMAMSMISNPKLLIADEPATALDTITKAEVIKYLNNWCSQHDSAMLVISHDNLVLNQLCDTFRPVQNGTVGERADSMESGNIQDNKPEPDRSESEVLLDIKDLSKTFGSKRRNKVRALKSISLTVHIGEVLGIVGGSGSGKTTLARCVAGLTSRDSGEIFYKDQSLNFRKDRLQRREIQMVFQDPYSALYPHKTAGYFLSEPLRLHFNLRGEELKRRTDELLQKVDLPTEYSERMPNTLSGGERQRIQIARALGLRPHLLICDESVTGLDAPVQAKILDLLKRLSSEHNMSIIFISHDLAAIRFIADRIVVMDQGQLVEVGSRDNVLSSPRSAAAKSLVSSLRELESNRT